MKHWNQNGFIDLALVGLLMVLLAAGGFTIWSIQRTDTTVSDTDKNTTVIDDAKGISEQVDELNQMNQDAASEAMSSDGNQSDSTIDDIFGEPATDPADPAPAEPAPTTDTLDDLF